MKLISDGRWYSVPERLIKDKSLLINYTQRKSSGTLLVEDSLISEIILESIVDEPLEFVRAKYGKENTATVDCELVPKLRDYQVSDISKMLSQINSLNRNKMGLGKTVEAVGLMRSLKAESVLIIVPKATILQWRDKIAEWWPERAEEIDILSKSPECGRICIYNYDILARDSRLLERLRSIQWNLVICDEAHRIKNRDSKRALAVKSLPAERKVALTGTPIVSRPNDLWSILNWLDVRYSGRSYWDFVNYFCSIKKSFWGNQIEGLTNNIFRVTILRKLLSRVSVSNDISVAPGKTIIEINLQMSPYQKVLFNKTKKLLLDELPETLTVANGAVLCTRLQQISSWPGVFSTEEKEIGPGAKFEWIQELLDDNPDEKFVVYTKFATTAEALTEYLKQRCVLYTGKMSGSERELSKKLFIESSSVRVIVGTIGAMGEGVDGLQLVSRSAIFIDRDWLPSTLEQCEDRLNRMGQKYPVVCYYLNCEKSFDQYVGKINMGKAEDIRKVLSS